MLKTTLPKRLPRPKDFAVFLCPFLMAGVRGIAFG
nr:MAG TPA: hypothetical protein [Caudoviricetes sp.]